MDGQLPSVGEETPARESVDGLSSMDSAPSAGGRRAILVSALLALGLPLAGFWLVRPDWFSRLNGLDSYFYTGYAQNMGDVIATSGDKHYFVSRWTVYLPNRLFFKLFGAETGFLMLRWLFAAVVCGAIFAIGWRRWRRSDTVGLVVLMLLMPMLLRTVLSDYVDSLTVPAGVACIAAVALRPRSRWTAGVVGALAAAILVANPIAFSIVLCLIPAWIRELRWTKFMATSFAIATGTFLAVLAGGLLIFRVRYGIPNVYAPTIDFMRTNTSLVDPLRSHRLFWMVHNIWIYLPLMVLAIWLYLARVAKVEFDGAERTILTTCGVQYLFQIWFQFGQHGITLEVPYYWSMIVPALLLSICVIVGKLVAHSHRLMLGAVAATLLVAILLWRSNVPDLYGSWLSAALVVIVVGIVWWRQGPFARSFGACSLVFLVFTFQVAAPRPEPLEPGQGFVDAAYETVYDADGSLGINGYRAATWFSDRMNELGSPTEQSAFFWIGGGEAHQMAAMFSAHVDGRWLNPGWTAATGLTLSKDFHWAIGQKIVETIVMLGVGDEIETMTRTLDGIRPGYRILFDGTAPDNAGTQVRVVTYDCHLSGRADLIVAVADVSTFALSERPALKDPVGQPCHVSLGLASTDPIGR